MTRRSFVGMASAAPALAAGPVRGSRYAPDGTLRTSLQRSAENLGLPGFVAGVVRGGKLAFVQAEGFADLESRTRMRQDHIFYLASLTKTFTAVLLLQYAQERKISLDDYVLDYPFLSVGFTPDRLLQPDVKLKHALSHPSEGTPGDNYRYNGGRYNFLYGVLEKISGNTTHYQAGAQELRRRIAEPLGLTSTLPGYPADSKDPRIPRITIPYFLDASHKTPTRDSGATGATILYPGAGLLSSVDDLAKYMIALDENVLLSADSYAHMTSPFMLNNGRRSSYGLGWSTQTVGGHAVHWHYGYEDSYSALLVRLPAKKMSFIFLANTGAASAPFLLGFGNLLTSPFAVAFLESALPGTLSGTDRDFAQLFLAHYTETAFGRNPGEAKRLLTQLSTRAPGHFQRSDWATIHLLSDRADPAFTKEMDRLIRAYRTSQAFQPDIHMAIASYYKKIGDTARHKLTLRQIADSAGYGEAGSTRDACLQMGIELIRSNKLSEGRAYLWKAAQYARTSGASTESLEELVRRLKG